MTNVFYAKRSFWKNVEKEINSVLAKKVDRVLLTSFEEHRYSIDIEYHWESLSEKESFSSPSHIHIRLIYDDRHGTPKKPAWEINISYQCNNYRVEVIDASYAARMILSDIDEFNEDNEEED